jgi:pyrimidine-specific ribonucleoside hydrolase
MRKKPLIIDCDPGQDDALMLMLAFGCGHFDIRGITTSAGNQTQDITLLNALRILTLIGADVPVYRGAEKPMFQELIAADYGNNVTDADGFSSLKATIEVQPCSAIDGIAKTLLASDEKITIVPTGPLTNIAAFLLAYPKLANRIERISMMGGGIFRGNMTPLAEFNIFADPEAASIVFNSGIPITMCGLDVTHKALYFKKDMDDLRAIGNKTGMAAADMLEFLSTLYKEQQTEFDGGTALHDPCAIAWLIDRSIFKTKQCYVDVETKGTLTRGATVVDFYNVLHKTPNAEVAYDIEREAYIEMILEAVKKLP